MAIRDFIIPGCIKTLAVSCLILQLSACSLDDGVAVSASSLTLSWTPPVQREDGSDLNSTDIDGYRIYYGISEGDYPNQIDIPDGSLSQITVAAAAGQAAVVISPGIYFFVMTAYDKEGRESQYSLSNKIDLNF